MNKVKHRGDNNRPPRVLFLVTEDWYFCLHHITIAKAVRDSGCEVTVVTNVQQHGQVILDQGFRLIALDFHRGSKNPGYDVLTLIRLIGIYRRERPDVVHHLALKPVVHGSLAAQLTGVPSIVNAIMGLGHLFSSPSFAVRLLRALVKIFLRLLLKRSNSWLILQQHDDFKTLSKGNMIAPDRTVIIRGTGVDLNRFVPRPEPPGDPVVSMVSRLIWDKGVGEFVEAARMLKRDGNKARLVLVGPCDPGNPKSVSEQQLREWEQNGIVEWWGYQEDVSQVYAQSHIAVLPSYYREGIPTTLLEALACARPIITTDMPGCREIVRHGENGLLVPPRDSQALFRAISTVLSDPCLRERMGRRSRSIAEAEFSEEQVINETLSLYRNLLG